MYSSVWNQTYHLAHYTFAFLLLFVWWPRLLFASFTSDRFVQITANYMKMVFLLIVIGYILAATKLYEVIAITAVLLILSFHRYTRSRTPIEREEYGKKWTTWLYDYFEGLIRLLPLAIHWAKERKSNAAADLRRIVSSSQKVALLVLIAVIYLISGYMRFYDAFASPVPNQSDGYVTLKWMKSIAARTLFPDGIYPMGHHIILAMIYKFANINALYVLKYTGPLYFLLLLASYYLFISRITKRKSGAVVAIIVLGMLSTMIMGDSYERQASSNSQEFSFIFALPTLYFFLVYMRTGSRQTMWSAAAGTAVLGLVHTITFVWIGMGMGVILLLQFAYKRKQDLERVIWLVAVGIGSVIVALVPIGYGYLAGIHVNSSVVSYANSRVENNLFPHLHWIDYATLLATAVILVHAAVQFKNKEFSYDRSFSVLFAGITFFIYVFGGELTHNEVVTSRSGDLWTLCIPLILGMAAQSVFDLWPKWRFKQQFELGICITVLVASIYFFPVKPIVPYKMESKTAVEQYLRITSMFRPTTFMIVSPRIEEYSLIYGLGNHMYLGDEGSPSLLKEYDPTKTPLTKYGWTEHAPVAPDIFIFQEKKLYMLDEKNSVYPLQKPKYEQYLKDYEQLSGWIAKAKASLPDDEFSVFYEDDDFTVYHLHRDDSKEREETMKKLYG